MSKFQPAPDFLLVADCIYYEEVGAQSIVLVYIGIYWYILVYIGIYWYIYFFSNELHVPVATGICFRVTSYLSMLPLMLPLTLKNVNGSMTKTMGSMKRLPHPISMKLQVQCVLVPCGPSSNFDGSWKWCYLQSFICYLHVLHHRPLS